MTDQEIFQKAIEKVLTNGFDIRKNWGYGPYFWKNMNEEQKFDFCKKLLSRYSQGYRSVIFSHDFAKAFFPKTDEHGFHKDDAWKYYLQQMVLEKKPLKYLEQYL